MNEKAYAEGRDLETLNCQTEIMELEDSTIDQQTQLNYRIWKKNTPYLYDYISTNSLLWPSLTVQFFPDLELSSKKEYNTSLKKESNDYDVNYQRLLLGTFTLGESVDNISILQLPSYRNLNENFSIDKLNYNYDKKEFEIPTLTKKKINVLQKINHFGDVNKARYMPQNPDIISTGNNMGDLVIYDRTKHSTFKSSLISDDSNVDQPQLLLINSNQDHGSDIFAIDWNRQKEGTIISADMKGNINVFDIRNNFVSKDDHCLYESCHFDNNKIGVNDIEWVPNHDSLFGMVDDSGRLRIFDIRDPTSSVMEQKQDQSINSLSINPGNNFCIATGDCSGTINVCDIRTLGTKGSESPYSFKGNNESITQLKWHPKYHSVVGSCSTDKFVKFFDLANFEDQSGLMFVHGGHMLGVNDFDWSLHDDWLTASVADDNSLHIWKPADQVISSYSSK
ncbi:uncharacterized protein PRCAT00004582001 [Priceomyces carsonii]|uniref:uncharacterized protein n=1 Tax=Priceomyces carsonii TaxID=28549 RepID=UPI002ED7878F|nr:unnamed protein product [Priceomyces carsonii]